MIFFFYSKRVIFPFHSKGKVRILTLNSLPIFSPWPCQAEGDFRMWGGSVVPFLLQDCLGCLGHFTPEGRQQPEKQSQNQWKSECWSKADSSPHLPKDGEV